MEEIAITRCGHPAVGGIQRMAKQPASRQPRRGRTRIELRDWAAMPVMIATRYAAHKSLWHRKLGRPAAVRFTN